MDIMWTVQVLKMKKKSQRYHVQTKRKRKKEKWCIQTIYDRSGFNIKFETLKTSLKLLINLLREQDLGGNYFQLFLKLG